MNFVKKLVDINASKIPDNKTIKDITRYFIQYFLNLKYRFVLTDFGKVSFNTVNEKSKASRDANKKANKNTNAGGIINTALKAMPCKPYCEYKNEVTPPYKTPFKATQTGTKKTPKIEPPNEKARNMNNIELKKEEIVILKKLLPLLSDMYSCIYSLFQFSNRLNLRLK